MANVLDDDDDAVGMRGLLLLPLTGGCFETGAWRTSQQRTTDGRPARRHHADSMGGLASHESPRPFDPAAFLLLKSGSQDRVSLMGTVERIRDDVSTSSHTLSHTTHTGRFQIKNAYIKWPILLYSLEACTLNKSDLNSLDFAVNRFS